ncbi:non-ribosomal peptide synthetase [Nocardia brasiliensis]|uniref:non-ribosomal peptide synthetase n=1 Tax=Nocardia brasiliensis TaxID=37326 RepID=UPI002455C145|nr:amino acid adenylation domain-containing protein [Nocardia brasiliensis]
MLFPLSPPQEIVWLHEQMRPDSRAYNFVATLDLWGDLDEPALRNALADILDRHAGLRLELVPHDSAGTAPQQRVRERCVPRIRSVDLSGASDAEAMFGALLRSEAQKPLNTFEAPLLRWCLARLGDSHHRLVHVEHHLIHDGHSFAILLRDLFTIYRAQVLGQEPGLPAPGSYESYAAASTGPRFRGHCAQSTAYWRDLLHNAAFDLPLPGLTKPGAQRRHAGRQLRQAIGADLAERLRAHSRERGHTPFATLLTLFGELLRRHSGRGDLVVGTAVANRPDGYEQTVGMFVNTIPLRLHPDPTRAACESVDQVTDTLLRALPHQHVPVQELTRSLSLHTHGADNPLFSVMFSSHDAVLPEIELPGLEVSLFEGFNLGTTRFDLDLVLLPDDRRTVGARHGAAGMTLVWDYDRDLFTAKTLQTMSNRFLDLVRAYLRAPDTPLAALAAPTEPIPSAHPLDVRPDEVLDPIGRHDPGTAAVGDGVRTLTYGELEHRVADLVDRMCAAGVTAGAPVATVLARGADSVVALLACLRMSAVYCPLSPDDPSPRLSTLLHRLEPALVLTTRERPLALPDNEFPVAFLGESAWPTARSIRSIDGAAYVIHTSGSTGVPKAVVVGRQALAHHVTNTARRFALTPQDRVLLFAKPSFDVALEEVLPALLAGASLISPRREVPTGPELAAVLAARRVTVANLPTSYLLAVRAELVEVLRDQRWVPRMIVLGGERLPAEAVREVLDATDATVLNAYGLTEATITSTVHELVRADSARFEEIPLGVELPGVYVHVLDAGMYPLPTGAVGELAVQGVGLAEGYLADDERTAARFVRVEALGRERVYLTGDLGYRDEHGRLHFLGRGDNQVKLRGYRIEPEEIEAAVSAELGGLSCAVVLDEQRPTGPRLVGFFEATEVDVQALHAALTQRLPAALVPGRWVSVPSMPMVPGGKPDRSALIALASELEEPAEDVAVEAISSPEIQLVAQGWREVLGHDRFTASSHFFQVGGHSMHAARLAAWLEPHLGTRPPMRVLFQNPVLAEQARAVHDGALAVPAERASQVHA